MTYDRFLLPAALALASGLAAQRVAEQEPNDTPAQAQSLVAGTQVTANLAAGERDWYSFTLAAPAQIHLRTSGNFGVNPSVDTGVFVYDATGATRLAWNDNAAGTMSDCGVTLPAGSYTALVAGKLATTAGDYGLDFVVLPAAPIQIVEATEPNGDPLSGGVPTQITLGDTFAGSLWSPSDNDWYTFTVTGRCVVQAVCYDDGGVPQLDNTALQLFHETSPGSWQPLGSSSSLSTSHRSFTLTHPEALGAGNYAIQVSAGSAAVGTAPFDYQKIGKYTVRTLLIDMPDASIAPEAIEPNDTPATAGFLFLGDSATGFITGSNEADWWGFTVSGPTTIVAMADLGVAPAITDTTVALYDINGTLITTASSGGPASHGRLIYTLPQAGLYYLAVSGGLFAATGNYVLHTGGASPLYVPSSFAATPPSTNACPGSNAMRPALTVASTEVPQLGSHFVVRLQNALPNALVLPFFGFSRTFAYAGSVPLPFDMAAIGAPGCFLRVDPRTLLVGVADSNGVAYLDFALPVVASLRGLPFFMQSVQFDQANNPLGISMSNDARVLLGDRGY